MVEGMAGVCFSFVIVEDIVVQCWRLLLQDDCRLEGDPYFDRGRRASSSFVDSLHSLHDFNWMKVERVTSEVDQWWYKDVYAYEVGGFR